MLGCFLILIKISANLSLPIPNPIKECIVCPPIINAAVPVVAVSPIFLLSFFNNSIINLIVYDLPVPAGPVINIFSPFFVCSAAKRCLLFNNSIRIRMYMYTYVYVFIAINKIYLSIFIFHIYYNYNYNLLINLMITLFFLQ